MSIQRRCKWWVIAPLHVALAISVAIVAPTGCAHHKNQVAQVAPLQNQATRVLPPPPAPTAQNVQDPPAVIPLAGADQPSVAPVQNPVQTVSAELPIAPVEPVRTPCPQEPPTEQTLQYTDLTLSQVVKMACESSKVIRDLGGRVISAPNSVSTEFDPEIRESHPRYGVPAAKSEFDPELRLHAGWERDYLAENNLFTYPNGIVDQSIPTMGYELSKYTEYGGRVYFRHNTFYESTNATNARFEGFWDTRVGFGIRQPLLRGAGREYNLVFGRSDNQDLLLSNGISIAQIDATASRYKLEAAVMKLLSEVEDSYWRLALAYHDLAAKVAARDRAFADWQRIRDLKQQGLQGGEAENEALARADFYATQQEVQDALFGTSTTPGVLQESRRLNELLGMPPSPNCVLRPIEAPSACKFVFDWQWIYNEAIAQRPELREQRLMLRRRQMQLSATRNTLLPKLDFVAEYNMQGYGERLTGQGEPFHSAAQTLGEGYNGGTMGLQAVWPLGERQSRSAVRYATLQTCRERAIFDEQKKQLAHELDAVRQQLERSQMVAETSRLRLEATEQNLAATEDAFRVARVPFDVVVDARRRLAEAQTAYYRAMIEYTIQLKNLQYAKGTLLADHGIQISSESSEEDDDVGSPPPEIKQPMDYRMPEFDYRKIAPQQTLSAS